MARVRHRAVHRYYFKLFALDTTLKLPAKSARKVLDAAMQGHIIGEATLMGGTPKEAAKETQSLLSVHLVGG